MKKFILTIIFALVTVTTFAQWTVTKNDGNLRFPVYTYTYVVDEGTLYYKSDADCYYITLSENTNLKFDTSRYVSFGYFMTKVYFYNESNIKIGEFNVQLYCNKINRNIHSAVNVESSRNILRYIKNESGYIKFIMPSDTGDVIEFIVFCNVQ